VFARESHRHIDPGGGAVILSCTLHTFGLGESAVAERLGDLMDRARQPSVGTTVSNGFVSLRINARFPSLVEAQAQLDQTVSACRATLGDLIFGSEQETLAGVVGDLLAVQGRTSRLPPTISTAEHGTGGLLAKMLTDDAATAPYFCEGYIVESDGGFAEILQMRADDSTKTGELAERAAHAMARRLESQSGAVYNIAVTCNPGPAGNNVGTTTIALATGNDVQCRQFNFAGDREMIRDRAAKTAITMLRYQLLGKPLPL
jgi:nicotinamide-nucleotide amidase